MILTTDGDCIIDHLTDNCGKDAAAMPRRTVCHLVASILQFVSTMVPQRDQSVADMVQGMHRAAFSTFQILAFKSVLFMIVVIVERSAPLQAAVCYKAIELHHALSQRIEGAMRKVVDRLVEHNASCMNNFTLESMLDVNDDSIPDIARLDQGSQDVVLSLFRDRLRESYGDSLRRVLERLVSTGAQVCQVCLCDEQMELLTMLVRSDSGLAECTEWSRAGKWVYSTAQKLCRRQSACNDELLFSNPSNYAFEVARLFEKSSSGMSLWRWQEGGQYAKVILSVVGPLRICMQMQDDVVQDRECSATSSLIVSCPSLKVFHLSSQDAPLYPEGVTPAIVSAVEELSDAVARVFHIPYREGSDSHSTTPEMPGAIGSPLGAVSSTAQAPKSDGFGPRPPVPDVPLAPLPSLSSPGATQEPPMPETWRRPEPDPPVGPSPHGYPPALPPDAPPALPLEQANKGKDLQGLSKQVCQAVVRSSLSSAEASSIQVMKEA